MADFLSTGGILAFLGYNAYLILMGMYFWKRIRIYALNPFSWCMLAVFWLLFLTGFWMKHFLPHRLADYIILHLALHCFLKDGIRSTRRRKECEFVVKTVTAPFGETVTVLSCLNYLLVIRIIKDGPFSILRSCVCRFQIICTAA